MKKKTKGKHHDQISIDEFNTSDDDILNYSLDWHTDWYIGQDEIVFGRVVPLYDIINSYFEALDSGERTR